MSILRQVNRIKRLFWYIVAVMIRFFIPVKRNRIFCWSYSNRKYSCSPRSITEYLLANVPDSYDIYWAFDNDVDVSKLDERINVVRKYGFKYLVALYSSKFIFCNARNNKFDSMFIKKRNQKYIQTWHGPFALKKIEKDVIDKLGGKYVSMAKHDSRMCDLMLSNSKFFTDLIKNAFWYDGEILEKCVPRNDVFYDSKRIESTYYDVRTQLGISCDTKIVLYAPTFRNNSNDLSLYSIDWNVIIPCLEHLLDGKVEVLVRLHPNIESLGNVDALTNFAHVRNITKAPDILDYLLASDAMISDYTSAMFDFSLLERPCFIYATDIQDYDRGFYWDLEKLPFPIAQTHDALESNLKTFNHDLYKIRLRDFMKNDWGLCEDGNACKRLYDWMLMQ